MPLCTVLVYLHAGQRDRAQHRDAAAVRAQHLWVAPPQLLSRYGGSDREQLRFDESSPNSVSHQIGRLVDIELTHDVGAVRVDGFETHA